MTAEKKLTATQQKMYAKKLASIQKDLESEEDVVLIAALKEAKEYGGPSLIPQLVNLLGKTESDAVRNELQSLFYGLKNQDVLPSLLDAIRSDDALIHRGFLISVLWQSRLDAEPIFMELIELAVDSDYMTILEIVTVVENMSRPSDDDTLTKAINLVQEKLQQGASGSEPMLTSLLDVLKERLIEG